MINSHCFKNREFEFRDQGFIREFPLFSAYGPDSPCSEVVRSPNHPRIEFLRTTVLQSGASSRGAGVLHPG